MAETRSKYPNDPEQTGWIALAKGGDPAAFGQLVEKYQGPVYNLCYHMLRNGTEAEDAAQEVFLRAYTKLDSYDDRRQFSTWLFSIASHYCLDRWKRRRFRLVSWENFGDWAGGESRVQPERVLLETEAAEEVEALLRSLRPDYRLVIILKYWHMMSYQEIAQTLDTTISTIKSKLFRARRMMARAAREQERRAVFSDRMGWVVT